MRLARNQLLVGGVHLLGGIGVALLVGGAWSQVILPLQKRSVELPRLKHALEAASQRCAELIQKNQQQTTLITAAAKTVQQEEARGMLNQTELAALVAAKCAAANIQLQSIGPAQDSGLEKGESAVQVRGVGTFPNLHTAVASLEAESAYFQVRAVTIEGTSPTLEGPCQLMWIVACTSPSASASVEGGPG